MMRYDQILELVQARANLNSREQADAVTRAVLHELGRRVEGDTANNFAAELPAEAKQAMQRPADTPAEKFGPDEFVRRVASSAHLSGDQALREIRAVMEALSESVEPGAVDHLWAQLPTDYLQLWVSPGNSYPSVAANTRSP